MSAPSDPFAVSKYDPAKLPAVGAGVASSTSNNFELVQLLVEGESAEANLQDIAAHDYLTTTALAAYEPRKWGVFDPGRLFSDGATEASGGWEELIPAMVPVEATDSQKQERRARLSVAIRLEALDKEEWPSGNTRRALVHALELNAKLRKRDEAGKIAVIEGRHLAAGLLPEAALKATAAELGCTPGKVRPLRAFPEYIARRDMAQRCAAKDNGRFIAFARRHAADEWFAGESIEAQIASANRVAAHIVTLMRDAMRGKSRKGKRPLMPPVHLRWDAFHVVEAFAKRRIPLTPVACAMVDHALGLLDGDGVPVAAPFAGIRKRDAFIAAAETEGVEELDPANMAGISGTLDAIREKGLPTVGEKQLRKWRTDESFQFIAARSRAAERRLVDG